MSTGNVKISQLTYKDNYFDYGKSSDLRIPLSKNNGSDDAPDWESLSIKGNTLANYIDSILGISIPSAEHMVPLHDSVNSLSTDKLGAEYFWTLLKRLGHNNTMNNNFFIDITSFNTNDGYISKTGEIKPSTTNTSFAHNTSAIHLKKGCLYALEINNANGLPGVNDIDIPADISWVTKIETITYSSKVEITPGVIETVQNTKEIYEPIPTHYFKSVDGGYGIPVYNYQRVSTYAAGSTQIAQGVLVFFASEDMDVRLSLPSSYWSPALNTSDDTKYLSEINFGLFVEFADQFLNVQGDLIKVLVEAIVKNRKDIQSLQANINSLGDVKANTIELDDYPVIQGSPMVIIKDRAPSAASDTHGEDIPNKIGQIWVDTSNKKAYIAVSLGAVSSWSPIN